MYDEQTIRALLQRVSSRELAPDAALEALRTLPFEDLGDATIDHHRALRRGFTETIFCQGKTPRQTATIAARLAAASPRLLGTRASAEHFAAAAAVVPGLQYDAGARALWLDREPDRPRRAGVALVTAGASDAPVADEAALTLDLLGHRADRINDIGVAGLHRLLHHLPRLRQARAIIVIAGMDGALPGVVAGLVSAPVVAVPTSVGYGASFGGIAALLTMLNACAEGIAVVNIDNGYGAAHFAAAVCGV